MPPDSCAHPEARVEWRKWLPSLGGPVRFRLQCLECLEGLGPKDTRPLDLPDGVDPSRLMMARLDVKKRTRGLGGRGNSKRRDLDKFYRSTKWRGRGGIRDQVLIRDGNRCADCGDRATDVAHITYPPNVWDTRPEHCKASCRACNQAERSHRITRAVLGPTCGSAPGGSRDTALRRTKVKESRYVGSGETRPDQGADDSGLDPGAVASHLASIQ